jgi:hypothetical protein
MATNTISGSLGTSGAGASVFFVETASGFFSQQKAAAIADANGNFTSLGLAQNATYLVIPVLYGAEFSPFSQSVPVVTSNVTGVNWSGSPSSYHLVQKFSDTMNRGGVTQDPIVGWTTFTSDAALQIVANAAQSTDISGTTNGAYPTGYTPAADCFAQFSIVQVLDDQQLLLVKIRQAANPSILGYQLEAFGGVGVAKDAGFQIADTGANSVLFSSPGFADSHSPLYTMNVGDVLLLLARGNNIYMFRNKVPLGAGTSTSSPLAGLSGIEIDPAEALNDAAVNNFIAGDVLAGAGAYSVPDDRNYATFPNAERTVQGTEIFDVQTSDNAAVPGVDSRAAGAPVDCRVSPNIPQNSRTPGTYGPGE